MIRTWQITWWDHRRDYYHVTNVRFGERGPLPDVWVSGRWIYYNGWPS